MNTLPFASQPLQRHPLRRGTHGSATAKALTIDEEAMFK